MILLRWTTENRRGQCDARCYLSKSKKQRCTCICQGKNHGIGLEKAIEQTRTNYTEWIQAFSSKVGMFTQANVNPFILYVELELEGMPEQRLFEDHKERENAPSIL